MTRHVLAAVVLSVLCWHSGSCPASQTPNSFADDREVYAWQREWTPQLRESLAEHAARFSRIVTLNAEVVWGKNVPRLITVPLDYSALRESVRAKATRSNTGLVEINLVNEGEADISSRPAVEVRWQKGRLVASDGQRGFQVLDSESNTLQFQTKTNLTRDRLLPGQSQVIGWLRFDTEVEVQVEIKNP